MTSTQKAVAFVSRFSFLVSRFSFLAISVFLIATSANSQIKIKEKVEINPKLNILLKPLAQHTIRVDLQWTPTDAYAAIRRVNYHPEDTCSIWGGTGNQTGGNLSYEVIDKVGGSYVFELSGGYSPCYPPTVIYFNYSIYYDNDSISGGSFTAPSYCEIIPSYVGLTSPLITDYDFEISSEDMCIGNRELMYFELGLGCTNVEIDTSTENINLQIIAGGEYASFYRNGELQGDYVSIPFSDRKSIELKQDEFNLGDETFVVVQSNLGGLIKQDSVKIYSKRDYELIVYYDDIPINIDQINYMGVYLDCLGGYIYELPADIKLNAEIIIGKDLGYLEDFDNGRTGSILNDIPILPTEGNLIGFVGNGTKITEMDTAIVRFKTSNPLLDSIDVPIVFTPGRIVVIIQPNTLSSGDTATVTIKERLDDGSIVEFPSDQTFELAVLDGCINGNFMVGDSINVYFEDALQPIKFVTSDTLDSEVDSVLIRVGTNLDEGGGGGISRPVRNIKGEEEKQITVDKINQETLHTGFAKMFAERKAEAEIKKKENNEPPIEVPIIEACYNGNYLYETDYWQGNIVVGDECDTWSCLSGFNDFNGLINIQEVEQDYNDINYCLFSSEHQYPPAAGIFKPLFDEVIYNSISEKIKDQLLVNFNLEVCYMNYNYNGYWRYRISENSIFLRAILDVCEDNILNSGTEFIIHNKSELSIIPNEEICLALENFEDQRKYGYGGKYYLIAPVWAHEKVHKQNFEKIINEVLKLKTTYFGNKYSYKDLLVSVFKLECYENSNSESKAKFQIRKYLVNILDLFVDDLYERYNKAIEDDDNERNTQSHPDVQWKITEYKIELQKKSLKQFWKDCPYREKDI